MELPDEVVEDLRKRLRRAEGQVQAVETMLADGRECRDIVDPAERGDQGARAGRLPTHRQRADLLRRASRGGGRVRLSPRRGPAAVHQVGVSRHRNTNEGITREKEQEPWDSPSSWHQLQAGLSGSSPVWR